jgi:heat shock protein HtpX
MLIIGTMAALTAFIGYQLFGGGALFFVAFTGIGLIALSPRITPRMLLSSRNIHEIGYADAPELYGITSELARRAGLPATPRLALIRSRVPNAFTVGNRQSSLIVVTTGLLGMLPRRELTGVLAHEVSHIRNGDLLLLMIAENVRRMTALMSQAGLFFLLFGLPLMLFTSFSMSLPLILLLLTAPTLSLLLRFALSRRREFLADAGATELTGDPGGLASALRLIAFPRVGIWDYFFSIKREQNRSLFQTHPDPQERIRRLELADRKLVESHGFRL